MQRRLCGRGLDFALLWLSEMCLKSCNWHVRLVSMDRRCRPFRSAIATAAPSRKDCRSWFHDSVSSISACSTRRASTHSRHCFPALAGVQSTSTTSFEQRTATKLFSSRSDRDHRAHEWRVNCGVHALASQRETCTMRERSGIRLRQWTRQ